jgi:hypothetical protein
MQLTCSKHHYKIDGLTQPPVPKLAFHKSSVLGNLTDSGRWPADVHVHMCVSQDNSGGKFRTKMAHTTWLCENEIGARLHRL